MSRDNMRLTGEAEDDRSDFIRNFEGYGCSCFISPPCSFCVHPGNPANQDECDECWEPEDFAARVDSRLDALRTRLHSEIDRAKGMEA